MPSIQTTATAINGEEPDSQLDIQMCEMQGLFLLVKLFL